jgi:acyl dehydratase
MIEVRDAASLRDRIGQELAVSEWIDVTQERIDRFAGATEDRQWIHVDAARAAAESPFRATIAHGFLTLSLVSRMVRSSMSFANMRMAINYGVNRVRFIAPVPSGSRVRGRISPLSIEEIGGGVQVVWSIVVEREGGDKPCCVAEWVVRYYPDHDQM